jgi:hypothetical protein
LILSCEDNNDLVGFAIIRGGNLVELWGKRNLNVYMALLNSAEKLWKPRASYYPLMVHGRSLDRYCLEKEWLAKLHV